MVDDLCQEEVGRCEHLLRREGAGEQKGRQEHRL